MTRQRARAAYVRFGDFLYPVSHWVELERFARGDDLDPKGLFRLADDSWVAWPYAADGRPTEANKYTFRFSRLRSFLKLYVKRYCYLRLVGHGGSITKKIVSLCSDIRLADTHVIEHGYRSIDDLATQTDFAALWEALLTTRRQGAGDPSQVMSWRQRATRQFWLHHSNYFGVPSFVPAVAKSVRPTAAEFAADESRIIPKAVIKQLVNKLALHRTWAAPLNRFHHLRLCVLLLMICLGRRVGEVLGTRRFAGPDGPLMRYPSRSGSSLWFRFRPSKGGPSDRVYISPEWEDLACYCVRELVKYGDEVRRFALPEESDLLILVSTWNWTLWSFSKRAIASKTIPDFTRGGALGGRARPRYKGKNRTSGLSYAALCSWANGQKGSSPARAARWGAMRLWNITLDGSAAGDIFRLYTHHARHTRHSALSLDPQVSLEAKQFDLNHAGPSQQLAYQHHLSQRNQEILAKVKGGSLLGKGVDVLKDLLAPRRLPVLQPGFSPGSPSALDERWRMLIAKSPHFVQLNRVPCGFCVMPQGPAACPEFLNCTECDEGGCKWFVTDADDEVMLAEIDDRAGGHRKLQQESAARGRSVQAGKSEVLARRTEQLRDEALRTASREMRERLVERRRRLEKDGL